MFEKAIDMLRSEETKPASMFGSAKISPNDIEQITAFLQEVAEQIADGEHHDRSRSPSPESRLIGRFLLVMAAWGFAIVAIDHWVWAGRPDSPPESSIKWRRAPRVRQ